MNKTRLSPPATWAPPTAAGDADATSLLWQCGRGLLRQLRGNLRETLADRDPEYLHQLRLAVRRLRVLLMLARGTDSDGALHPVCDELKWLARQLGPARDADVFRLEVWPPLRLRIGDGRLAQALDTAWLAQRQRAARRAHRALAAPRFRKLLCALESFFAGQPSRSSATRDAGFVHAAIRRRVRRVRAAYAETGKDDTGHDRRLHGLRIEIKKLRYALEFLAPLLKRHRTGRALKHLSRLQAVLGEMNDIATAQARIDTALGRHRSVAAACARQALEPWRSQRMKMLRRKFGAAWKAYQQLKHLA